MTVIVSTEADIKALKEKMPEPKRKGFDAFAFCGRVKFDEDALVIQKRIRNEWAKRTS